MASRHKRGTSMRSSSALQSTASTQQQLQQQQPQDCATGEMMDCTLGEVLLLVTPLDCFSHNLTFVFGVARCGVGAIVSTTRLQGDGVFLLREATHEIGHILSLRHCMRNTHDGIACAMTYSSTVEHARIKDFRICQFCEDTLSTAQRDAVQRQRNARAAADSQQAHAGGGKQQQDKVAAAEKAQTSSRGGALAGTLAPARASLQQTRPSETPAAAAGSSRITRSRNAHNNNQTSPGSRKRRCESSSLDNLNAVASSISNDSNTMRSRASAEPAQLAARSTQLQNRDTAGLPTERTTRTLRSNSQRFPPLLHSLGAPPVASGPRNLADNLTAAHVSNDMDVEQRHQQQQPPPYWQSRVPSMLSPGLLQPLRSWSPNSLLPLPPLTQPLPPNGMTLNVRASRSRR
jgi:predicted Zn-dependent protease